MGLKSPGMRVTMKKPKTTFLLSEICLAILLLLSVGQMFADEKPQKRVAVIGE